MRFRATPLAAVLAVVAIVLAAYAATLLGVGGSGSVDALLEGLDLPEGLGIRIGSVGRQIFSGLVLNDVSISWRGETVCAVGKVRVSASVEELAAHLASGEAVYDVELEGLEASLDEGQAGAIMALASAGGAQAAPAGGLASRTGLRVRLSGGRVAVRGREFFLETDSLDLRAEAGLGMKVLSVAATAGGARGGLRGEEFSAEGLELSYQSGGRLALSARKARGSLEGARAEAEGLEAGLDGERFSAAWDALQVERGEASLRAGRLQASGKADLAGAVGRLRLDSCQAAFQGAEATLDEIRGGFAGGSGAFCVDLDILSAEAGSEGRVARLEEASLQAGLDSEKRTLEGAVSARRMRVAGLDMLGLEDADIALPQLDLSLGDGRLEGRFSSRLSATERQSLIGDFSLDVFAEASVRSKDDFSLKLDIDNLRLQHVEDALSVEAEASIAPGAPLKAKAAAVLGETLSLDAALDGERRTGNAALKLKGFEPGKLEFYLSLLPPEAAAVLKEASLDLDLDLDIQGLDPLAGELTFALDARGLAVGGSKTDISASFEGGAEGGRLEARSLGVSCGGWSAEGRGALEKGLLETAALALDRGGAQVARLSLAQPGKGLWDFDADFPSAPGLRWKGTLETSEEGRIEAATVLTSNGVDLPVSASLRTDQLALGLRAEGLEASATLAEGRLAGKVRARGFKLGELAGKGLWTVDFDAEGRFDGLGKGWSLDLGSFVLRERGRRLLGLDLQARPGLAKARNIFLGPAGQTRFWGEGSLAAKEPGALLGPSSDATLRLSNLAGESASLSLTGGVCYIDIKNFDLGRLGLGPARAGLAWLGRLGGDGYGSLTLEKDGRKLVCGISAEEGDAPCPVPQNGGVEVRLDRRTKRLAGEIRLEDAAHFRAGDRRRRLEASFALDLAPLFGRLGSIARLDLPEDPLDLLAGVGGTLGIGRLDIGETRMAPADLELSIDGGRLAARGPLMDLSYDLESGALKASVDRRWGIGLEAEGSAGRGALDVDIKSLSFPLVLLNELMDLSTVPFVEGEATGFVRILGGEDGPKMFGNLYAQRISVEVFWVPDTVFTIANGTMALAGDRAWSPAQRLLIRRKDTNQISYGTMSTEFDLGGGSWELDLRPEGRTVGLWVPIPSLSVDGRANVGGRVRIGARDGLGYVEGDVDMEGLEVSFDLPSDAVPAWYLTPAQDTRYDLRVRMVRDNSLFYPARGNPVLRLKIRDGESFDFGYRTDTGKFTASGSLALMGGDIYYFQRNFLVTEGKLNFGARSAPLEEGALDVTVDLRAKLTSRDSKGGKVDVFLILQNSRLEKPEPVFASIPAMGEQEIMRILGRTLLPAPAFDAAGLSSLASVTAAMTMAAGRLRLISLGEENFGLANAIRDSLGLDLFSVRSNLVQNILLDAIPGAALGPGLSPLARYLDGTDIFAGKRLAPDLFIRAAVGFRADPLAGRGGVGIAGGDLRIDFETSLEWETPPAVFTVFARPQELSVFGLFDTIGFSVTKTLRF